MAGENFDDAFASFLKDEPNEFKRPDENAPAKVTPIVDPPPVVLNADGSAPVPTPPPVGTAVEPETEIDPPDPADPAEPPAPVAEAPKPTPTDEALTRLADMMAQRQPQPQQQAPQPQQQAPQALFTPEDQNFLTQYMTDFPDVARAERLMRQAEYGMLATRIYNEVAAYFAPKLALLEQMADSMAYGQLSQKIPDYDTVRDGMVAWVKSMPPYLQAGMNHVIQQGTPDEIADLVGRYRQATGATSPNPENAPQGGRQATPQPPAKAPELSPQARQAAQRLAPVSGKRSAPTQAAPQTFDDAFDAFAKAG